jgi:hypothetical protein
VAERQLPKLNVAGSIPVSRSTFAHIQRKTKRPRSQARPFCLYSLLLTLYYFLTLTSAVCTFCSVGSV